MLKKILSVAFASVMSISFLAACNFTQINTKKYYEQVVASASFVGKNDTLYERDFTMKDLLNGYSTYGSQFKENGSDAKTAVQSTLDTLIQRWILIERIKEEIELTQAEIEDVKRETYKNINEQLAELETTIRKEWDRVVEDGEDAEAAAPLRKEYTEYEQKFEKKVVDGVQKLVRIIDTTEQEVVLAGEFTQSITDPEVSAEAMKRFTKQLRQISEMESDTIKTDAELLQEEVDRVYEILKDNKYISVFQDKYLEGVEVSTSQVVEYYNMMFNSQYAQYADDFAAYHAKMRGGSDEVYYHPVADQYGYVTHVLIKFSDEQNAEIDELNKLLSSNSITKEIYNTKLEIIKNKTVVKYNYTDETTGELGVSTKHINTVYNEIITAVNTYGTDLTARANAFNEFIYKYNDDEGIMNKDFGYTVNLNTNNGENLMIPEFSDAVQEMFRSGTIGDVSELVYAEYESGKFGFHIIMSLGVAKNEIIANKGATVTWQALFDLKTQPSSNKTLFNVIYDTLQLDANLAQTRMNSMVLETNETQNIKYYESRYSNLWK